MPAKWQQWMPFHIDKFMGSRYVQAMQPCGRAGYLYLLAAQWQSDDCSLPNDEEELAVLSGLGCSMWQEHSRSIMRHFAPTDDGRIQNSVLFVEWSEAKRIFDARRSAANKTNERSPHGHRTVRKLSPSRSADTRTLTETVTETEEKEVLTDLGDKSPVSRPEEFANCWNRNRGALPKVTQFTDSRRKKVQSHIRQGVAIAEFEKAVKMCALEPFLTGSNDRGWCADFDWLMENDRNIHAVLEGKYGSRKPAGNEIENIPLGELVRQRRAASGVADGNSTGSMGVPEADAGAKAVAH